MFILTMILRVSVSVSVNVSDIANWCCYLLFDITIVVDVAICFMILLYDSC